MARAVVSVDFGCRTFEHPGLNYWSVILRNLALLALALLTAAIPLRSPAQPQCSALFALKAIEHQVRPEPFDPSRRYDAETLGQRLLAVRASRRIPENGVIRAGGGSKPRYLPTLHFSLGEVVRSHSVGREWDEMPYAVITTLKSLEPQLVNLMPYDTYILGDFKLPPEAILVLPRGHEHLAPTGIRVVTYDDRSTSLRAAVDKVVQDEGGWPVRGLDNAGTMYHPTTINGWNINTREFFQPILDRNPGVSYGQHIVAESGTAASFGAIDLWLRGPFLKLERGDVFPIETETLRFEMGLALAHRNKLQKEIGHRSFPPAALEAFAKANARLEGWLNIAELELSLREKSGKSLFALISKAKRDGFLELRASKTQLDEYTRSHLGELADFKEPGSSSSPIRTAKYLAQSLQHFPREEKDALLAKYPGVSRGTTPTLIELFYNTERALMVSPRQAQQEGLLLAIEHAATEVEKITPALKRAEILDSFHQQLTYLMNREFKRMSTVLAIIGLPTVRKLLNADLSFNLPNRNPLSFKDYLQADPEIRTLLEPLPPLPQDPDVLALMKAVSKELKPVSIPPTPYTNLSVPSQAIGSVSTYRAHLAAVPQLEERPADVVLKTRYYDPNGTILAGIKAMSPVYLESIWKGLGLYDQFRAAFPTNDDFWRANEPFIEIYRRLKAKAP